jgi:hypothetical protein
MPPDVIAHHSHGSPSIEWKEGKLGQVSRMSYTLESYLNCDGELN